jgi:hypothetical protein
MKCDEIRRTTLDAADIAAYFETLYDLNWWKVACKAGPELEALFDAMDWIHPQIQRWTEKDDPRRLSQSKPGV